MEKYILKKSEIKVVEIELTGLCNLKCPLCSRNHLQAGHVLHKNVRHIDEIKKQLDQYVNLKHFFIAGAVSEPTMYKYLLEFIEYLNSRKITYELFTNGNTHKLEWWEKLGSLVLDNSRILFTVCGSTQELHEKYRVGSNLQQILDNAAAFRKNGRKNDYVQFIRFEYNKEDLKTEKMKNILKQFSNYMITDSKGVKEKTEYHKSFDDDIKPILNRDKIIKVIFRDRPKLNDNKKYEIKCASFEEGKIYINQWGQVSACYIHAENEKDYFENEEFDYSDILSFKYPDCYLCEKRTKNLIDKMELDFIFG